MPQISVIVPVYKVEKYIHRCVDSILSQIFSDFELLLVDDGSPDRCGAICDEYAARDDRVTVIHQENGGVSAARNAGIDWAFEYSDSQWIFFVDSDDWIHERMLESLVNGAKTTGLDVVIGGFHRAKGTEATIEDPSFKAKAWKTEKLFFEKPVTATTPWGKLYRKECFTDIRYPVGKKHEDEWVTYKILFLYSHVGFIDVPLYFYFQNPEGIVSTQKAADMISLLDAQEERIAFFRKSGKRELCVREKLSYRRNLKKYISNGEKYGFQDTQLDELSQRLIRSKKGSSASEKVKDIYPFAMVCLKKARLFFTSLCKSGKH